MFLLQLMCILFSSKLIKSSVLNDIKPHFKIMWFVAIGRVVDLNGIVSANVVNCRK